MVTFNSNLCLVSAFRGRPTVSPKGTVRFWSRNKAVANAFPYRAEPSSVTRTRQYRLD